MSSLGAPPIFTPNLNVIRIDTTTSSKIAAVNLYFGKAQITRVYAFRASPGANRLVISGLPESMDNSTLRVEGCGQGLIHDVSVSYAEKAQPPTTSETLVGLLAKKEEVEQALERTRKCLKGLERYLETLDVNHVNFSQLSGIMDNFEASTAKYDAQHLALKKELHDIEEAIETEKAPLQSIGQEDSRLRKMATIGLFADKEGGFEIRLIYVVNATASWSASYDVRATTQSNESTLQVVYKASITQSTGEDWNEVPLTLETTSPSFDPALPSLGLWKLSVYKPPVQVAYSSSRRPSSAIFKKSAIKLKTSEELAEDSDDDMGFGLFDEGALARSQAAVISKGNLIASFLIPGLVTVPTGNESFTFTIQDLRLESKLSWIAIPKLDPKARLTARITNNSNYPLIPGRANVFVDGTYISLVGFPGVRPHETFNFPLGVDPSLQIVYHPSESKATKSGFYTKSSNTSFSQRITVHNTKSSPISGVTIIDQIPVSDDSQVSVVLKNPRLTFPGESKTVPSFLVEDGVTAYWHDSGDTGDIVSLGKDGKLEWVCSFAPQKKLNLLLQWEVSFPSQTVVTGLDTR